MISSVRISTLCRAQSVRFLSEQVAPNKKKPSAAQLRKERNILAKSSLRDILDSIVPGSVQDDDVTKYDPTPVYDDYRKYNSLSYPQQRYIIDSFKDDKFRKPWGKIPKSMKRLNYYISYGNYGPRDGFQPVESDQPSFDLPFRLPSIITTHIPKPSTLVRKLPPVNYRTCGEKRKEQYEKERRMDPISKMIIFSTLILTVINFKRDRKVVNTDHVPVNEYEEYQRVLEKEERDYREMLEARDNPQPSNSDSKTRKRRWYYLWIR
ncbi:BA75_00379T0 [Komagataella pastoris]|uniref:BA75_00379T0 n=1 Tax=Komagataella pastoris TaxID=4922 RepID=A0A1B2J7Z9_PICPA|nr:BA75_00379T0 [Komagataella pastoris]